MNDWPQIHERHGPLVWKTVYRILRDHTEALDCFQEVFARYSAFIVAIGAGLASFPTLAGRATGPRSAEEAPSRRQASGTR